MYLEKIALKNFRNYETCEIEDVSRGINMFVGGNAQGKTNFLEAVNYVSWGRSMRGVPDRETVRHECRSATIDARFFTGDYARHIEEEFDRDGKKRITVDGEPLPRISLLVGIANTIVFSPDDLRTVKDSPSMRRRMIDQEISKVRPVYYRDLTTYMNALREKNSLLKMPNIDRKLIESYNEQLADWGTRVIERRGGFCDTLKKEAAKIHARLGGGEKLELTYNCCCDRSDIKKSLLEKLDRSYERECEYRACLTGPQREDIDIKIDGKSAKSFGSQGQQRSAILSIKIACAMLARAATGDPPVLLLDDVFSELDSDRRLALVEITDGFQVFITGTELLEEYGAKDMKVFTVDSGRITERI